MSALSKFFLRFCANLFCLRFSLIACNSPRLKHNRPTAPKTSIPPPCGEKTAASPRLLALLAAAPAEAQTDRERQKDREGQRRGERERDLKRERETEREREKDRARQRKTEKNRERQRKTEKDRDSKLTSQVKQHPTNRIILKGMWFAKSKHLSPRPNIESSQRHGGERETAHARKCRRRRAQKERARQEPCCITHPNTKHPFTTFSDPTRCLDKGPADLRLTSSCLPG